MRDLRAESGRATRATGASPRRSCRGWLYSWDAGRGPVGPPTGWSRQSGVGAGAGGGVFVCPAQPSSPSRVEAHTTAPPRSAFEPPVVCRGAAFPCCPPQSPPQAKTQEGKVWSLRECGLPHLSRLQGRDQPLGGPPHSSDLVPPHALTLREDCGGKPQREVETTE